MLQKFLFALILLTYQLCHGASFEYVIFGADHQLRLKGKLEWTSLNKQKLVILIPGLNAFDEEGTFGQTKIFKQLSQAFLNKGIAVFRFSKRRFIYQQQLKDKLISFHEDTIDDVLDAIKTLKLHPRFKNHKIYLVGHSFGGTLSPLIASLNGKIDGIALLGATSRHPFELMHDQLRFMLTLPSNRKPYYEEQLKTLSNLTKAEKFRQLKSTDIFLSQPVSYWMDWKSKSLEAAPLASKLNIPIFIAGFGNDFMVTDKDFLRFKETLAHRKRASFAWYPDLNHYMIKVRSKQDFLDKGIEYRLCDKLLDQLSIWVLNH